MKITISSGHGKFVRGAKGHIDEVDEARRVVAEVAKVLRAAKHTVNVFNDDVSRDRSANLRRIVQHHNASNRDLDVSIHFNDAASASANGTECWHASQARLAKDVAHATAIAGGLTNRKDKKGTFYFLTNCRKPAVLHEVCFVRNKSDCDKYKKNFTAICAGIAGALVGEAAIPVPPPTGPDIEGRPTLRRGSKGPDVTYLQQLLNEENRAGLATDGDFGPATDSAVRVYQGSRRLSVDGIVGKDTWYALENDLEPVHPPELPKGLSDVEIRELCDMAAKSNIAKYKWKNRGVAPRGYIKGVVLVYASVYRQWKRGYPPALEMAKAMESGETDALAWYGMVGGGGLGTLRALWTLLMGLGMRESTGKFCQGKDPGASNTTAETCEAGAWQTSYNARFFKRDLFDTLFNAYRSGGGTDPQGFLEVFREGVTCSTANLKNYGSGNGLIHQQMSKNQPAYAAEVTALIMRNARKHWGPLNRKEAESHPDANNLLAMVQSYIDAADVPEEGPSGDTVATADTEAVQSDSVSASDDGPDSTA